MIEKNSSDLKRIIIYSVSSTLILLAGIVTGILISSKVTKKYNLIKKDVTDLGSDVKDDLSKGYEEISKDLKK